LKLFQLEPYNQIYKARGLQIQLLSLFCTIITYIDNGAILFDTALL